MYGRVCAAAAAIGAVAAAASPNISTAAALDVRQSKRDRGPTIILDGRNDSKFEAGTLSIHGGDGGDGDAIPEKEMCVGILASQALRFASTTSFSAACS